MIKHPYVKEDVSL